MVRNGPMGTVMNHWPSCNQAETAPSRAFQRSRQGAVCASARRQRKRGGRASDAPDTRKRKRRRGHSSSGKRLSNSRAAVDRRSVACDFHALRRTWASLRGERQIETWPRHPDPKVSTIKQLYGSAATHSARMGCTEPLYRVVPELDARAECLVAQMAESEGPRYDSNMSAEDNRGASSRLGVISTRGSLVTDSPFGTELPREWKNAHRAGAGRGHHLRPIDRPARLSRPACGFRCARRLSRSPGLADR